MKRRVHYSDGFKYQLRVSFEILLPKAFWVESAIDTDFISLEKSGALFIAKGYAWDGASGPVIDRPSTKRGSLVHDALYQLLRAGLLPQEMRADCDEMFRRLCVQDGVWRWVARAYVRGLARFGSHAADTHNQRPVLTAP